MADLDRLCIHTMTTKPWSLELATEEFQKRNVGGISVWQNAVEPIGISAARKVLESSELEIVSYVRGGFFPGPDDSARQKAIDHNKAMISEAAELGAPMLVLVCGAEPSATKIENETQIIAGIEAILPWAIEHKVILGIEPLHPMYADTRSAINTLAQATRVAKHFENTHVQVVFDVYHLWWDPNLYADIDDAFAQDVFAAYHICDWLVPTTDMLTDRGVMGDGCIDLQGIDKKIQAHGYEGFLEVEIFSEKHWAQDQGIYLDQIISAYHKLY